MFMIKNGEGVHGFVKFFYILLLLSNLLLAACDLFRTDEFDVITIRNANQGINLFGPELNFSDHGKKEFKLLARNGQILQVSNKSIVLFQLLSQDGKNISINTKEKDSFLYEINHQNAILFLNNTPAAWQWLANAPEREIKSIRSLIFSRIDEQLKATQLGFLRKLARNEYIGLAFTDYRSQNLIDILNILKPNWLYLDNDNNTPVEETRLSFKLGLTLASQRQLKTLILANSRNNPHYIYQLIAFFPGIKSLWLNSYILKEAETGIFPQNLANLEELVINGDINNYTFLKKLRHLTRLTIHGSIKDKTDSLNQLSDLQALNLYENTTSFPILNSLTELHAFSFPANTSQVNFAAFCQERKQLSHVELINCDQINDFSPLLNLQQLTGLVLVNESITDITPLTKLQKLKYLVLSASMNKNQINKIKAALPHCQIIYGEMYGEPFNFGIILLIILALTIAGFLTNYFIRRMKSIRR